MDWKAHLVRISNHVETWDDIPDKAKQPAEHATFAAKARKKVEPWLSAVFQAEHLNVLLGSGFSTALCYEAKTGAVGMGKANFKTEFDDKINAHAEDAAKRMRRGAANIEDQFHSALSVLEGLRVTDDAKAEKVRLALNSELKAFLHSLLKMERDFQGANDSVRAKAESLLQSFLLSFASRTASRERLHIFTTNYDRFVENGCDLAGLRIIDRFVGALNPFFRSSRIEVDVHYNPPGIRGEPRFMEGVLRLTKLHGSLDWYYDVANRRILRKGLPFGATETHSDLPTEPIDSLLIYPNPAKDVETTAYPYAELFRDFAAAVCRPNAVVVCYGYGFGDDHINRVLLDMLTIPSTHLVAVVYGVDDRLKVFCENTRESQVTLLTGSHFADLETLIRYYLPKPALDYITGRMSDLLNRRAGAEMAVAGESGNAEAGEKE